MIESPYAESFIVQNLAPYIKKKSGNAGFIMCPFHGDNDPSLRVLIKTENGYPPGSYHCFGCGAHGSYNTLAKRLGLPEIDKLSLLEEQPRLVKDKFDSANLPSQNYLEIPDQEEIPDNAIWRGLTGKFLKQWGCVLAPDPAYWLNNGQSSLPLGFSQEKTKRLYIFSYYRNEPVGWIAYRIQGNFEPKVYNMPGMWSSRHFLPNVTGMTDRVCIVEGPYDALRLCYYGIPAMCTLGVQSWNEQKVAKLVQGNFNKILIIGDGDNAGHAFNERVSNSLAPFGLGEIFHLPRTQTVIEDGQEKKMDPGNMPENFINAVRDRLFS